MYSRTGAAFAQPPVLASAGGNATVDLRWIEYEGPLCTATTRALGGRIPGPTLQLRAGDTLLLRFVNALRYQGGASSRENDWSNLHFHGLHADIDDSAQPVGPRAERIYMVSLAADHEPGTHWLHPHVHGSSMLQLGGGAAAAIIVQDPPGYLPEPVAAARDLLWVVQHFSSEQLMAESSLTRDATFSVRETDPEDGDEAWEGGDGGAQCDGGRKCAHTRIHTAFPRAPALNVVLYRRCLPSFTLINGLYQPVITVAPGEWIRARLVYTGLKETPARALDLRV